jgi:NADH-quinone oxidoreductase subunit N
MISGQDILRLLPMEILAGGMLFTMLLLTVKRNHWLIFTSTLLVLAASLVALICDRHGTTHAIGELFLMDPFGLYYQALILLASIVVTIFSYLSIRKFFPARRKEEYYLLLLLATFGAAMMVISTHFISFFVSLEILNISLYTLISYYRDRTNSIEAGLKYLVLAAMSSAFLLFGMALIYAITGTMAFHGLSGITSVLGASSSLMLLAGIGLMIVGIGFKLGLVPFHMWTPDVYEGASSPVTAFIATISKGAIAAVLLRFFMMADLYNSQKIMLAFTVIAILSMLTGNLLAIRQDNLKRMLAYSSIAHFGYLLVALLAGRQIGLAAATFYITAYIITILGAFGLITVLSDSDTEATDIVSYNGLFWRKPVLAALLTVILLSLAGIPLTAGFMGKYFLLTAGVGKGNWLLVFTLVISSVIGLYYYLRFIVAMMKQDQEAIPLAKHSARSSLTGILLLTILGTLIVWLGLSPAWLFGLAREMVGK